MYPLHGTYVGLIESERLVQVWRAGGIGSARRLIATPAIQWGAVGWATGSYLFPLEKKCEI